MAWKKADLIYLAGYLDGEGCFTLAGTQNGTVSIHCETTCKPTIRWIADTFGGNFEELLVKRKSNHRPTYRWTVNGRKGAVQLCSALLPYLKEKRQQAALLVEFDKRPRYQGVRFGIPKEAIRYRATVVAKLKQMKKATYELG